MNVRGILVLPPESVSMSPCKDRPLCLHAELVAEFTTAFTIRSPESPGWNQLLEALPDCLNGAEMAAAGICDSLAMSHRGDGWPNASE